MDQYQYSPDLSPYDIPDYEGSRQLRWLSWPLLLVGICLPLTILVAVESQHLGAALLAYVNCVIGFWLILHALKHDPLLGLLSAISLPLFLTAWSVPTLYYSIFHIPAGYSTLYAAFSSLDGQVRIQTACLVFFTGMVPLLMLFFHWQPVEAGAPIQNPHRLARVVALICILITAEYDITRIFITNPERGNGIIWWTWGFYNYCNGLYIILGALHLYLSKSLKLFLVVFLCAHLFIFAVGNARLPGLFPLLFYTFGYLFLSGISQKQKMAAVLALGIALPIYVVIGNTTRTVLGNASFSNFGERVKVLLQGPAASERARGSFSSTMDRLFMTGGHNIILRTPEEIPYLGFDLVSYGTEMANSLLPQILFARTFYASNYHLRRYGFNMDYTSIEISQLGHFWMLGGWYAVFLGGIATALVMGTAMAFIRSARNTSWIKAMVFASILSTVMFDSSANDFIAFARSVIWRGMMAYCIYTLIRLLVPQSAETSDSSLNYPTYSMTAG